MKVRRVPKIETLGYCHDCHNRSRIVVTFAHRPPIRLCDRCGGFLIENVSQVINRNGKSHNNPLRTPSLEGKSSNRNSQEGIQ